jgi:branched-chain amino acid transport system permease protein
MLDLSAHAIIQSIINGLCLAWIYILIAAGLSLIFGIMDILQFAHGEVYMLGAYFVYYFNVMLGLNFFLALVLSILLMGIVGIILEKFIFRSLKGDFLSTLIISLGLMILLQSSVQVTFGVTPKSIPSFYPHIADFMGVKIGGDRLIVVGISIAIILGLIIMLKKTKLGQALTASAQHPDASRLMGINPYLMAATAMTLGSALAGAAGGLMGSIFKLDPFMGGNALLKGLIIIILGGKRSLLGVIVAGLIVGLIDGLVPVLFGPAVTAIVPLFLVAIIVVVKPQGIFGYAE